MNRRIICKTCGTQYNETVPPPGGCPICNDDRQYVPDSGQAWTNLDYLQRNHSNIITPLGEGLYQLQSAPSFGIGQRAFLVVAPGGNILWDCIALINEPTIEFIRSKGGLKAIAFSHPHYYTTMNEWAAVFDCPVYIHANDEPWVYNKGPKINLWRGEEKILNDEIRIINVGGHFPGSCVLQVPFLSKEGTMLCGDTFYISPSKKHFAFMYSYPNRIPLPLAEIKRIKEKMAAIPFDRIHGFYEYQDIYTDAKQIMEQSFARYI